jgi:hypothetical protein
MNKPTRLRPEPRETPVGLSPATRNMLARLQERIETMLAMPPSFLGRGNGRPNPDLASQYDIIIDGFGIKNLDPSRNFEPSMDGITQVHLERAKKRIAEGQVAPPEEKPGERVHKMLEDKIPYEDRRGEPAPERVDGDKTT